MLFQSPQFSRVISPKLTLSCYQLINPYDAFLKGLFMKSDKEKKVSEVYLGFVFFTLLFSISKKDNYCFKIADTFS